MFQLRWFIKYMGAKRNYFFIGIALSAITSVMTIFIPMLSQRLIDDVITPKDTTLLIPILAMMLCIKVLRESLRYLMIVLLEKNSQQMNIDLRSKMYDVIQNQDYKFFSRTQTGDLMTSMTSDLDMLRHSAAWISYVTVDSVVVFLAAIIYLFSVNWRLSLCLSAILPFIFIVTRIFSKAVRPVYTRMRESVMEMSTVAQENIDANRVVKAFAREEYEKEKFAEKNSDYRDINLKAAYTGVKFQPVLEFLSQAMTVITIGVGGIFMIRGQLSAGQMLAFSTLTWALSNPLRNLGVLISDYQRFFTSANRVIAIFYAKPSIVDRASAMEFKPEKPVSVEFENVSFRTREKEIIKNISFTIDAGKTLGILGTTGSGKTSLVNMLGRFYEPAEGVVKVNGENINNYTLSSLRKAVGFAMQDVFLFSNSVDSNIAYGDPETPFEQVVQSAVAADADGFIKRMADGYDTLVGERGVGLSGGQKQRISLARALCKKPALLILDDTTSAVDMETELYIQAQMKKLDFSCTKIIIAQRVSSLQNADLIIVMDEGEIIERGSHKELLALGGYYHRIWSLQNGGEVYGA